VLRAATLSDLTVIASWIASARECELWAGRRVRFPIDHAGLPEAIGFAETNSFSLQDTDEVVAFGQLVARGASRAHLARVIVAPRHRSHGFGEILVRELTAKARRNWFERISLNVDEANPPAISLYSKLGFRDATRPVNEPESPRSLYMELTLASPQGGTI
jgi:ribosomal protein S18 acetylase RimI-like enzyme